MSNVFLDTAFAIALLNKRDQYHKRAGALLEELEREGTSVVTTQAVLIEIGNALTALALRSIAAGYIDRLERDASVEVLVLSGELFQEGLALYQERSDKAWGLTNCISFVVMQERGISEALTADKHFEGWIQSLASLMGDHRHCPYPHSARTTPRLKNTIKNGTSQDLVTYLTRSMQRSRFQPGYTWTLSHSGL